MSELRAIYESGCCKENMGCNVATTCMCAIAEDALDEIERLRNAAMIAYGALSAANYDGRFAPVLGAMELVLFPLDDAINIGNRAPEQPDAHRR